MKVLVADKISPKGVAHLRQQPGFEVREAYGATPAQLLELVRDVHAIAVRSETFVGYFLKPNFTAVITEHCVQLLP